MLTPPRKVAWPLPLLLIFVSALPAIAGQAAVVEAPKLIAETYDSGFPLAHDTYNGMAAGSDGRIYYVLCSQALRRGGADVLVRSGQPTPSGTWAT